LIRYKNEVIVRSEIAFDNLHIIAYNEAGLIFGNSRGDGNKTLSGFFEILAPITLGMRKNELDKTLEFKFGREIAH
jgi:hypothetical protein